MPRLSAYPGKFSQEETKALFSVHDQAPTSLVCSTTLPPEAGSLFSQMDFDGIQESFSMAEFLAAIDHAEFCTAPGPDGIQGEVFKNVDGTALQ